MIPLGDINWIGVAVGGIAAFIVGMIWYSPALFGKEWMKLMKITEKEMMQNKDGMMAIMAQSLIMGLVMAFVLFHVLAFAGVARLLDAAMMGFWVWLGFVATTLYMGVLYEKKSMKWFYISAGYYLVSFMITAMVLVSV